MVSILRLSNGNVALGYNNGQVDILDPSNGFSSLQTLNGQTDSVYALLQLSNGNLMSGSYDNTIFVWDTSSYTKISKLTDHTNQVYSIVQMDNGQVASGSYAEIIIWDVSSATPSAVNTIPAPGLYSATAIPGPTVIMGNGNDLMTQFETFSGSSLATAQGLGGTSYWLIYCPAANGIINSEQTSTVEVWTGWAALNN